MSFGGEGPNPGTGAGNAASGADDGGEVAGDRNALEAKGCSCRTVAGSDTTSSVLLALLGLGILAARRKR